MKEIHFKKIRNMCQNIYYKLVEIKRHYILMQMFKDPYRVKIYSSVKLTKTQEKQIDDFYLKNYGHKIPYIYHRHSMAFTGKFDVTYFPELLYAPEFDLYMHSNPEYARVLGDKNLLPILTHQAGIKTPKTILSCMAGTFRDNDNHILSKDEFIRKLSNIGESFVKPSVDSMQGKNCILINMVKGIDQISGKTVDKILKNFTRDFIIQERLHCHKVIEKINSSSVNTFRIITYLWKDKIYHCPIFMRIGKGGSCVDNAGAGGIFVAVDDDGTLHKTAFTEFNIRYTEHPDTHIRFAGYKIPHFEKLIRAAYRMQEIMPHLGICHWDFTLDPQGEPVLLEINTQGGSFWISQLSHGKGLFGDNTAEILQWIAKMKKLSYIDRKCYRYGCMEK